MTRAQRKNGFAVADLAALATTVFADIRAFSRDGAGVSRPAFSDIETRTLDYLSDIAREQGLEVQQDAAGNRVFSLPGDNGSESAILIGSHVDTVPEGGNYDGLAGVVAGLLVLVEARQSGRTFRAPVRCIAMRAEESAWFGACYIGSRTLTGQLGTAELNAPHRGDGRPLRAHMRAIGIETDAVEAGQPLTDLSRIREYLELHIEQGPLLAERGLPVAVVTGIRGNIRYRAVRCIGEAGHSGAVPRDYRHDPVLAMAELLTDLDHEWDRVLEAEGDLVLTSGIVATDPARHAMARIADDVIFSLDIRSRDIATLDAMRAFLAQRIAGISARRRVTFETGPEVPAAPALMAPQITAGLCKAAQSLGQQGFTMASGAGHDAAIFAQAGIPAGMVFVRNHNGSHNPHEAMEIADMLVGVQILSTYLQAPTSL
ncbi:Zn-dependent hydrolase [Rhodobacter sp. 24-YEA-8]|uniref:Zn-dependent hydrolase n=1 Tax=Rhodobacter sp. 24-YEA-8 TaxID=1884310 RepID=UPI000897CA49|nr:Zn-dependent hydrolase [Rhodobacter sp. 24-YEA-8]SED62840.1 N-carbamoyl-L-amino-acid hydrolase [Rhodobacter sp. 24-YEA-8]